MQYVHDFGRVFSACLKCTPVVTISLKQKKT